MSKEQKVVFEYLNPNNIQCEVPELQQLREAKPENQDGALQNNNGGGVYVSKDGAEMVIIGDEFYAPVYSVKKVEAEFTTSKGDDMKLQKVIVTENISEQSDAKMLQLTNPAFSEVYSEVIRDPQPLRSFSDYNNDDQDNDKRTESKIPKLKQVVQIYKDRKKAANELKESQVPSSQQRRSSIPRLKKGAKLNKNVEEKDKDETPPPEDEFDRIYDEIVLSDNEVLDIKALDKIEVGDADKVEHKFKEIIHDYKENKGQPIDVKEVRSRIPLVKQKSFPELQLEKKYSRRSSLKNIPIDNKIIHDTSAKTNTADIKLESKLNTFDVFKPVAPIKESINKEIDINSNDPTYKTEHLIKQYDQDNLSENEKGSVTQIPLNPVIKSLLTEAVIVEKPDFISINPPATITRTLVDTEKDKNVHMYDDIIENLLDKNLVELTEMDKESEIKHNNYVPTYEYENKDTSMHVNRSNSTDLSFKPIKQVDLEFVPKENIIVGETRTDSYYKVSTSDNNTDEEISNDDDANEKKNKYGLAQKIRRDSVEKLRYSRSDSVPMGADKTAHETPPNTPNVQNELQDLIKASDKNCYINYEKNTENYNETINTPVNEDIDVHVTNDDLIFGDVENSREQTSSQNAKSSSEATNLLLDNVVIELSPLDRTMNDGVNDFTPTIHAIEDVDLKIVGAADNSFNTTTELKPSEILDNNISIIEEKVNNEPIIKGKVNRIISKLHSVDETVPKKEIELPVKKSVLSKIAMFETRTKESTYYKKPKTPRGMELSIDILSKPKIVDQVYKNDTEPKLIKEEVLNYIERDIKPSDYYFKSLEAFESEPRNVLEKTTDTMTNKDTSTRQDIKNDLNETLADKRLKSDLTREDNIDLHLINQRHYVKTLEGKAENKHTFNDDFSIESRLRRLESNDGRESVTKSKSMAELHLLKGKVSQIQEMIDRINSVDNANADKKNNLLNKAKPRQKSVSDKVALFERKLITIEMSTDPKPAVTQTTDSDSVRVMTDEEYEKRISDLRAAKEKFGVCDDMKYITLRNGVEMPVVALGTALIDPALLPHIIGAAIDMGFRAIDTAYIYGNEKQIGEAIQAKIQDGTVKREDLFIIGKLWSTFHRRDLVAAACKASLENLGLDYFDLYLVHNPMSFKEGGDPIPKIANVLQYSEVDYLEAWYGMENLVSKGLARSIGVSNFNSEQVAKVVDKGRIKPVVNQVECHPYLNQLRLDHFCADRDIKLMCFGTLGSKGTPDKFKSSKASVIDDPLVKVMAAGLNVTPAQLLIRYQIECGHAIVSKMSKPEHMWEVLQALKFHLTLTEVDALHALNRNKRTYSFEGMGDTHKNYPFKIPF